MSVATASSRPTQDVPVLRVALPQNPRAWDTDVQALSSALQTGGGMAIVGFKPPSSPRTLENSGLHAATSAAVVAQGLKLLDSLGIEVTHFFPPIGAAEVRVGATQAVALLRSPLVDYVEPSLGSVRAATLLLSPLTSAEVRAPAAVLSQFAPWGVTMLGAPDVWTTTTGSGVEIEVVGDGIGSHPDLPVIPQSNCVGYYPECSPNSFDVASAGAMMALNNGFGTVGVAPGIQGANVITWGACDSTFACNRTSAIDAIDAAPSYQAKVLALNYISDQYNAAEATAVARALSFDVVVVASAADNRSNVTIYPAAYSGVIAVSGVNPDSAFVGSNVQAECTGEYSNYGNFVTLAAPFSGVTTYRGTYVMACGTAMAENYIAGTVALVRSAHPSWSRTDVLNALYQTARDLGAPGRDPYYGYGLASASRAALNYPPPPPPLSSYIISNFPTFIMYPVGGAPPYTYYWEACVANCGGGAAAPTVGGGVRPNLPIQGWYFWSTNYSVTWSTHNSYLRCTVTDSHSQQSQSQVYVP